WALTGKSGISKFRGVLHESPSGMVLPTFHPAAVLRTWALRSIVVADFVKGVSFLNGTMAAPTTDYTLHLNPTVADFPRFRALVAGASRLGVDVETSRGQITLVGFAISPTEGFCIPFWDPDT